MFSKFKKQAAGNDQQERERQAVEAAGERCREAVTKIEGPALAGDAAEVERLVKRANDTLKTQTKADRGLVRQLAARMKQLETDANLKAADLALDRAMTFALDDKPMGRTREITAARGFLRKAASLGAPRQVVQIAETKIETIMLSGGVRKDGPTLAKPLDLTAKPPNKAKGDTPDRRMS